MGFQGKHKITDQWEVNFYKIISQRNDQLPVFLVQNLSDGKERMLHQNMLYPVQFDLGSDENNIEDVVKSSVAEQNSYIDGVHETNPDEVDRPIYQGPQTRSRTNLLMKANIVMNEHFVVNSDFVSNILRPRWLNLYQKIWHQFMQLLHLC